MALAESEAQAWEAQTAKLRSESAVEVNAIFEQIKFFKEKADSIKMKPMSPDRLAVAKREREAQMRVLKA